MLSDHPELIACHLKSWVRVNVLHYNRRKRKQGVLQIFTMSRIDRIGKTNGRRFCAFRFWFAVCQIAVLEPKSETLADKFLRVRSDPIMMRSQNYDAMPAIAAAPRTEQSSGGAAFFVATGIMFSRVAGLIRE